MRNLEESLKDFEEEMRLEKIVAEFEQVCGNLDDVIEPYLCDKFAHDQSLLLKEGTVNLYIKALKFLYDLPYRLEGDGVDDNTSSLDLDGSVNQPNLLDLQHLVETNRDAAVKLLDDFGDTLEERLNHVYVDEGNSSVVKFAITVFNHYKMFLERLMESKSPDLGEYNPDDDALNTDFGDWKMFESGIYLLKDFENWLLLSEHKDGATTYSYISMLKRIYKNFFQKLPEYKLLLDLPRLIKEEPGEVNALLNRLMGKLKGEIVSNEDESKSDIPKSAQASGKTVFAYYITFIQRLLEKGGARRRHIARYRERLIDNLRMYLSEEEEREIYGATNSKDMDVRGNIRGGLLGLAVASSVGRYMQLMKKAEWETGELFETLDDVDDNDDECLRSSDYWTVEVEQMMCFLKSIVLHNGKLVMADVETDVKALPDNDYWRGNASAVQSIIFDEEMKTMLPVSPTPFTGVLTASLLGLLYYPNTHILKEKVKEVCEHWPFDDTSAEVVVLMARIINSVSAWDEAPERDIVYWASECSDQVKACVEKGCYEDLEELQPIDEQTPDTPLHALGVALWAFYTAKSYKEGIEWIAYGKGDNMLSLMWAGLLLGFKFGIKGIPPYNIYKLKHVGKLFLLAGGVQSIGTKMLFDTL